MRNFNRGLAPIVIILIIAAALALAGGGWWLYQRQKRTLESPTDKLITTNPLPKSETYPKAVSSSTNVVLNSDQLYYTDFNTGEIKLFDASTGATSSFSPTLGYQADRLDFTNDGRYLFFSYGAASPGDYLDAYDFNNKSVIQIAVGPNANLEVLSPSQKYVVVDTGTGPGDRGRSFINLDSTKVILDTYGTDVLWSPDSTKFILEQGAVDISNFIGASNGTNDSIYIGYPQETTTTMNILLRGTNQITYKPLQWIDNNNVIYQQITFEKPFLDTSSTQSLCDNNSCGEAYSNYWYKIYNNGYNNGEHYFKININTHAIQEVAKPNIPAKNFSDLFESKLSPSGMWKVVFKNYSARSFLATAYLVSQNNSRSIKLGVVDVSGLAWRPLK